jgi:hypothetical protein
MKKFSAEEAKDLKPLGKTRTSPVNLAVFALQVGEAVQIETTEWKRKTAPTLGIKKLAAKLGRKFDYGRSPDGNGWLIKRTK